VAERERFGPGLPAARDLGDGIEARKYWRQSPLTHEPVERTSKMRVIAANQEAGASTEQKIDLVM